MGPINHGLASGNHAHSCIKGGANPGFGLSGF